MMHWAEVDWAARRMGLSAPPTARERDVYQLARIRETVAHARVHSPFYRARRKWPEALPESLADVARLPFTWPEDLARNDPPLVAVPRDAIARMVTLDTSGTTGTPKRIAFTAGDLEDTTDYFHHGMAQFTRPGDRVGIVFPASRPGSIGTDLVEATRRLGATPLAVPTFPLSAEDLLAWIRAERPDVLFGPPVPFLAAARLSHADGGPIPRIRAALISSDTASRALVEALQGLWGCEVFDHWGMTETGYGGALDCPRHIGAHVRETDLYLEAVDPLSGTPCPPGEEGEIVLTTLRRTGLPLIRYRTGDLGRLIDEPCPCGSVFRRLVGLGRRIGGVFPLSAGGTLSRATMDEALLPLETVTDYTALIEEDAPATLRVEIASPSELRADTPATTSPETSARQSLLADPAIGTAVAVHGLRVEITRAEAALLPQGGKRGVKRIRQGTWPWAVLFDLDGTLAHTLPAVRATLNDTLQSFGKAPLCLETVARLIGGGAGALMERAARERHEPLSREERDAMIAHYVALYPAHEMALSTLDPDALEVARRLMREGRAVAIVTNKRTRDAERLVKHLGLAPFVSTIVGGDASLSNKPDPDLLLLACRKLDCAVGEALFVGDGPEDGAAARAVAMPFVQVDRSGRAPASSPSQTVIPGLNRFDPLLFGNIQTC